MPAALCRRAPRRLLSQPAVPVRLPVSPVPAIRHVSLLGTGFPVGASCVGGLFFSGGLFGSHAAIVLFICPNRVLNRVQKP